MARHPLRTYWIIAFSIVLLWTLVMQLLGWWAMLAETWPMSLTMVVGSFIAGATAEGGGAVAFPVFTKLFDIAPGDAKIFSFMIQSFGMTMAGLVIWLRGIRVLWNVVALALPAGITGLIIGELFLDFPDPYPRLIFTITAAIFGAFLLINRWWINGHAVDVLPIRWPSVGFPLAITALIGGMLSSVMGVGLDMSLFIVLTLLYGINEKVSTPTTVVLMGLLSVTGFFWHGAVTHTISPEVWRYWMSCIPVVIFGAPLGAWYCEKVQRDHLIGILILLILLELISTIWLIPIDTVQALVMGVAAIASAILFYILLRGRA
ncbi:MAG: TSUP family transporter [Bacteroidota bacterium]